MTKKQTPEEFLQNEFPHGHPEFVSLCIEMMKLHNDKNHDYAKGGDPLGNFKRIAAILSKYDLKLSDPITIMIVYMLKQFDAVMWGMSQNIEHKVEGPIERLKDMMVYSGLGICELLDRSKLRKPFSDEDRGRCERAIRNSIGCSGSEYGTEGE